MVEIAIIAVFAMAAFVVITSLADSTLRYVSAVKALQMRKHARANVTAIESRAAEPVLRPLSRTRLTTTQSPDYHRGYRAAA